MPDAPTVATPPPRPPSQHPIQDALARLLGVSAEQRAAIVRDMFARHSGDAVSYWLQIVLATGIATLGLVLSSTGVVIGAMLISPLMSPIVGLGMGLAVGAPLLTLRSMFRVAASIVWVVGLAALLTVGLPFHETTSEIAARTSPTVLDLAVAAFCALAAGFTTARQTADTTSAAAGTAIGISLVPPLCVAGYGLGVGQGEIFGGALLLFTANFCAIIFCSALLFVGLGFNHITLDEDVEVGLGARLARRLRPILGARYGVMWRLVLPTLLLASVYVPLRAALGEVAWKIRVRDSVTQILRELAPEDRSVRTNLSVDSSAVRVQLALMGSPEEAQAVEQELRVRVAAVAGLTPQVDVTAVPDDVALRRIAEAVAAPRPAPAPRPVPVLAAAALRKPIDDALASHWPASAGAIQRWVIDFGADGPPVVHVEYVGEPLGAAAEALLGDFLGLALGEPIRVRAEPVLMGTWIGGSEPDTAFVGHLARALAAAEREPQLRACVRRPRPVEPEPVAAPPPRSPASGAPAPPRPASERPNPSSADALLEAFAGRAVDVSEGPAWAVELTIGPCPAPEPPPPVAGP